MSALGRHPLAGEFVNAVRASAEDMDDDYPKAGLVAMARKSGTTLYGWIEEVDVEWGALSMLHASSRSSLLAPLDFAENRLHVVLDDITSIRRIAPDEIPRGPFAGA